jgi:hypothetical protein
LAATGVKSRFIQYKKPGSCFGAEMFESDNQLILDEYLQGLISQSRFEAEARLWPNYRTDYKPLVELARENKLRFVATNIPRRYASVVNSKGFEGLDELSEQAKLCCRPLPVIYNPDLKAYSSMLEMEGMENHTGMKTFPKPRLLRMPPWPILLWKTGHLENCFCISTVLIIPIILKASTGT